VSRKVTRMSLEGGVLFFEDGTEVSGVSAEMIQAAPKMLKYLKIVCEAGQFNVMSDWTEATKLIGRLEGTE